MESSNYYENKTNRQFLNEAKKNAKQKPEQQEEKTEKWKETAKDVGTDLVAGVLGGGLAAAAIGKPALLVGLIVSGYGHYAQNKVISALGLGMMASGTMSALNGKAQSPDITDRLKLFKEELLRKLYLDKLSPVKKNSLSGNETSTTVIFAPQASDFASPETLANQSSLNANEEIQGIPKIKTDKFDWDFNDRIY